MYAVDAVSGTVKDRLVVALDVPREDDAKQLMKKLAPFVGWFKVGPEVAFRFPWNEIGEKGRRQIFLDAKFHDIPRTMRAALKGAQDYGVGMVTVQSEALRGCDPLRGGSDATPLVWGVTVLTSLDQNDLKQAGYAFGLEELLKRRTALAMEKGCAGVVAAVGDIPNVRQAMNGHSGMVLCPGIRPSWASVKNDDQKRTATPGEAIRAGADYIVVGRPITQASDPVEAVQRILDEMDQAFNERAAATPNFTRP